MDNLIVQIAAAVNMRTLYPANHPRVVDSIESVIGSLVRAVAETHNDSVTFLIVGEDLVADDQIVRRTTLSQQQFIDILKRRGIERMTLASGLEPAELDELVTALAIGGTPAGSAHVILGRVNVAIGGEGEDEEGPHAPLNAGQLDTMREAFAQFRDKGKLPLREMEELVWSFMDSLSRTTRSILPLAKLKEHDEYTFVHSVNVSLLVLAQARSFGIKGSELHALGMAGLLHDIGKLMVPLTVLNKPGKLEGEEWAMMQSHTEQGAWHLSETPGATPLSIVVAYEHHLRVDGQPNYPQVKSGRVPNLASRMTSIADTFDAMQT
ncbi:MAG TPA: HD domain-containing phosphohydrolase, partial [Thermoanaerobaculia bacterium]|nr:HD domain-containing phosphohydrolase [Thermoanaerobaculia bacterium]